MHTDFMSKPKAKRTLFTEEEDQKLFKLVKSSSNCLNWKTIAIDMKGKTARQCRERYNNYLDPKLKHSEWSPSEDELIISQYSQLGNSWQKIADLLYGRTASAVRNRLFYLLRKSKFNSKSDSSTDSDNDTKNEMELMSKFPYYVDFRVPLIDIPQDSIFFQNA
ncbi:Myb-like DNA-binding domain containing protein [Trichomonas vaginalis G3]|uniref:Myb-like DNA-binding domain containing protein n=1 Tax=Trichomonas vaginalis (strain ATCC PRA-98 / G3) TaxID=412133 RepID=A2GJ41_TRIV3|nr:RNA polymerase II transcription regulator recruiting protein [Trichomonas vaginalis G3]EAX82826.1 Myb-like DNA-binding domain containing protein [Trichomonas vaginalis G3]KAI5527514.1 RNA polymerase II transcription regulator recruiting protein [Trichomonas vaginalis G3]|eukprot:XP_001295756.1 Myb-like DNA-binding domain containing protein [Trichomonas vaginalis G3]